MTRLRRARTPEPPGLGRMVARDSTAAAFLALLYFLALGAMFDVADEEIDEEVTDQTADVPYLARQMSCRGSRTPEVWEPPL